MYTELGPPAQIGPYRVLAPLGSGGMASVFRAERVGDEGFRKTVALKRMHAHFRHDSRIEARFFAEARTNARLTHPNLVQVIDFGATHTAEGGAEHYLAMELVDGVTLAELLTRLGQRQDRMPVAHALAIVSQCAAALDYVHRRKDEQGEPLGIVHRDVSPQNVLLSWEGEVKVSDFGLAKSADQEMLTTIGTRLGKIAYMSPEQFDGVWVDARTDVWALGVVLWECLTQRRMMPSDVLQAAMKIKGGGFEAPSSIRPEVPPDIDAIIARTLEPDADRRLSTARELARATRAALHRTAPGFGAEDLAELLSTCFPDRAP